VEKKELEAVSDSSLLHIVRVTIRNSIELTRYQSGSTAIRQTRTSAVRGLMSAVGTPSSVCEGCHSCTGSCVAPERGIGESKDSLVNKALFYVNHSPCCKACSIFEAEDAQQDAQSAWQWRLTAVRISSNQIKNGDAVDCVVRSCKESSEAAMIRY
jgi:hypothetical protein